MAMGGIPTLPRRVQGLGLFSSTSLLDLLTAYDSDNRPPAFLVSDAGV